MKQIQTFILPILLLALAACGTLAPGGAYKDKTLYDADVAITTGYDVLHNFVTWEYQNRGALKTFPDITKAADNVRANARTWISSAIALREAYAANPIKDNADKLQASIDIIRAAMTEATKYLVQTDTISTPTR